MRATSPSPTCSRPRSLAVLAGRWAYALTVAHSAAASASAVSPPSLLDGQQQGIQKGAGVSFGAEVDSAAVALLVARQTQHLDHVGHQPGMGRGGVDGGGQGIVLAFAEQIGQRAEAAEAREDLGLIDRVQLGRRLGVAEGRIQRLAEFFK